MPRGDARRSRPARDARGRDRRAARVRPHRRRARPGPRGRGRRRRAARPARRRRGVAAPAGLALRRAVRAHTDRERLAARSERVRAVGRGARERRLAGPLRGCALGKPIEMWPRAEIRRYLERTGDYPIADYLPAGRAGSRRLPAAQPVLAGVHARPHRRDAARRRHRLHDARPARPRGARARLRDGGRRRRLAAPLPVRGGLHRRARRLPQPDPRTAPAGHRHPRQPLPRVDRRPDPRRRLRLREPRRRRRPPRAWPPPTRCSATPATGSTERCGQLR